MALNKVEICGVNTASLPLLTNEEKEELFIRIEQGDQEAREQYIRRPVSSWMYRAYESHRQF